MFRSNNDGLRVSDGSGRANEMERRFASMHSRLGWHCRPALRGRCLRPLHCGVPPRTVHALLDVLTTIMPDGRPVLLQLWRRFVTKWRGETTSTYILPIWPPGARRCKPQVGTGVFLSVAYHSRESSGPSCQVTGLAVLRQVLRFHASYAKASCLLPGAESVLRRANTQLAQWPLRHPHTVCAARGRRIASTAAFGVRWSL